MKNEHPDCTVLPATGVLPGPPLAEPKGKPEGKKDTDQSIHTGQVPRAKQGIKEGREREF